MSLPCTMAVSAEAVHQASGTTMLKRATELDGEGRYTEALVFYQSGIEQLMEVLKGMQDDAKRQHYRQKISEYMARAEKIKDHVNKEKQAGKYHEQIRIEADSIGHSYSSIFSPYMDSCLTQVDVEDPYIRTHHQISNFLRFCELLVASECARVRQINLVTGTDDSPDSRKQQGEKLAELGRSLSEHGVQLRVQFSSTLHDREIRFNNGWIIKVGRGLDIFRPAPGKFSLGSFEYNLRHCHETTVDIFHQKHTKVT